MSLISGIRTKLRRAEAYNAGPVRKPRFSKHNLLGRPLRRKDSGTSATNFRARAKAKRVRLRKLQRQARRKQR